MTGLLGGFGGELGKNLAEKWLSLLALPGALFLAVLAAAAALGQSHALDLVALVHQVTEWAHDPAATTVGGQVVLLAAVLAVSIAAGLVARVLGAVLEKVVLAADWRSWPAPGRALARRRTHSRRARWDEAHRRYSTHWTEAAQATALNRTVDPAARQAALRARTAIAPERPDRPTWTGDRIQGVSVRLLRDHRLDLGLIWPNLWLILPEPERAEITAARTAMTRGAELGAWAVLYAPVTYFWWPTGVIAVLLVLIARQRFRAATDTYARLVEAAVRLHARDLARQLGLDLPATLPADAGDQFDQLLNSAPPPEQS